MTISRQRFLAFSMAMLFLALILPVDVGANATQPPCLTVLVLDAPDDLEITLTCSDGTVTEAKKLRSDRRGWETYFRLDTLYPMDYSKETLGNATLSAVCSEYTVTCSLPSDAQREYNNLVILDPETQTVRSGTYPGRYAVIVTMRVAATLILEGIVFFLFGLRERRSWGMFVLINLVTQAFLNVAFAGTDYEAYMMMYLYAAVEIVVFLVEMGAFPVAVREQSRKRMVVYALAANAVSLFAGGLLLSYMPV